MWQIYFTQWKAQVCDNLIVVSERLKYVTIIFYSVKGSSMWQLDFLSERFKQVTIKFYSVEGLRMWQLEFTQWKAQACEN
jgi:hypothetical protein